MIGRTIEMIVRGWRRRRASDSWSAVTRLGRSPLVPAAIGASDRAVRRLGALATRRRRRSVAASIVRAASRRSALGRRLRRADRLDARPAVARRRHRRGSPVAAQPLDDLGDGVQAGRDTRRGRSRAPPRAAPRAGRRGVDGRRRARCRRRRPRTSVCASETATPGRPCSRAKSAARSLPLPTRRARCGSRRSRRARGQPRPVAGVARAREPRKRSNGCGMPTRPPSRGPRRSSRRPTGRAATAARGTGDQVAVGGPDLLADDDRQVGRLAGATSRASSAPSIRSWSVIARWVRPRRRRGRTSDAGLVSESNDAELWQCRSTNARGPRAGRTLAGAVIESAQTAARATS